MTTVVLSTFEILRFVWKKLIYSLVLLDFFAFCNIVKIWDFFQKLTASNWPHYLDIFCVCATNHNWEQRRNRIEWMEKLEEKKSQRGVMIKLFRRWVTNTLVNIFVCKCNSHEIDCVICVFRLKCDFKSSHSHFDRMWTSYFFLKWNPVSDLEIMTLSEKKEKHSKHTHTHSVILYTYNICMNTIIKFCEKQSMANLRK